MATVLFDHTRHRAEIAVDPLEQALGLPRVVPAGQAPVPSPPPSSNAVVLQADKVGLVLWVFEGIV